MPSPYHGESVRRFKSVSLVPPEDSPALNKDLPILELCLQYQGCIVRQFKISSFWFSVNWSVLFNFLGVFFATKSSDLVSAPGYQFSDTCCGRKTMLYILYKDVLMGLFYFHLYYIWVFIVIHVLVTFLCLPYVNKVFGFFL